MALWSEVLSTPMMKGSTLLVDRIDACPVTLTVAMDDPPAAEPKLSVAVPVVAISYQT